MNPLHELRVWRALAETAGEREPNAMALATCTPSGVPSVRIVLLRGITDDSLHFFTNYRSRKGKELEANSRAAACFHWSSIGRQVRVEGPAVQLDDSLSEAYFAARPLGHQVAAVVSPQSSPIESIERLRMDAAAMLADLGPTTVPRPRHWGGYSLMAERVEFWIQGPDRLHDRCLWTRDGEVWREQRLAP